VLVPNVRNRYVEMVADLDEVLMREPERGREELRGILGEKITLQPDASGRFMNYRLSLAA